MKTHMLVAGSLTLMLAACAQAPKPVAVAAAPADAAAPPATLAAPQAEQTDTATATAQRNLKALGYAAGKTVDDPALARAILAFEKDQGMTEDGRLTPAVLEKLRVVRAALQKTPPADAWRNAVFVYGDGSVRRQPLGVFAAPEGLVSEAAVIPPLRPGAQATYNFGHRAKDGHFTPALAVACRAGRMTQVNTGLGLLDILAVDCHGDGAAPLQWHAAYSPRLGAVTHLEGSGGVRELVAIRPVTADWPSAARTGLDWALTHALDTPGSASVPWSSTAVTAHFEISAGPRLTGSEAGLPGRYAAQSCRRFTVTQGLGTTSQYPGIACQSGAGWWLPGSKSPLASPSSQSRTAQNAL